MTVLRPNAVKLYSFLSRLIHLQQQGEFPDNPRILDVGAGGPLPPLTLFYEQGFDCEGIDISATQLKNAEAYCQENKLDIHFQQGDMRAIPFEDQTFDCVYEQYAMCHLPKAGIQEAVNEMLRVTKPGGYCMLGFISMDSWPKSLFGPEQAPGEYLSVVEGDEGIHSMLTDEEADKFVSGWQIVNKEKVIRYSLESAKKPSLDDWAALKTDGYEGLSAAEWEERYPLRFQMYNYSHLFYILKKG